MASRNVDQLKTHYPDPQWRSKFVRYCALVDILADCTIADNYVISDELNGAIKLSEVGNNTLKTLTLKHKVNAKDARLLCALHVGHDELYVDIDNIDLDKLEKAIHNGLQKSVIQFPFIHGRDLYDAYADLFEDEKDLLDNEETLRLLDRLPAGVFQYGIYTVGPFGLRRSLSPRNISSSRRVAAYHCSRPTCHRLHSVLLQTGHDASIHREREKLDKIIRDSRTEPSEWWAFNSELSGLSSSYYGDQRAGVLLPLIGDTLSDVELKALVSYLLDNTKGELRKALSTFLQVGAAADLVEPFNRAELLQLALIASEESVGNAIDQLVRSDRIHVPPGDVRRPVINSRARSGAFRLHAELGHHGFRFVSEDAGLALLRERQLLSKLYVRGQDIEIEELEWQLRGIDIDDLDERLEHFFHSRPPREALERLVLARKTNMITACHELGIEQGIDMGDELLIDTLLWKLGFPHNTNEDPHAIFWQQHERLWALTQSSAIGTSHRFRETAAPYFADLEGLLLDSLAFTSWALLVDHTQSDYPFTYDDFEDRNDGLALLDSARSSQNNTDTTSTGFRDERVELRALMEGFLVLAKHLESCRVTAETYKRPTAEFPEFDGKTELKHYLLRSTVPFLDLSRPSQDRIIEGLKAISATMISADVNLVRNDYAHYRRTAPDISRVEQALEATRQSVTKIENHGFCRLLFSPSTVTTDRWGQSRHDFTGPRSYEHRFSRPTTVDWMGLPSITEPQYLVRSASFGDPNEVLRFTRRYHSEFSKMWSGFPNRRRRGPGSPDVEEEPAHQTDVEISSN